MILFFDIATNSKTSSLWRKEFHPRCYIWYCLYYCLHTTSGQLLSSYLKIINIYNNAIMDTVCINMFVSLAQYALHTQLRKLHHSGGLGQLICVACKRTCTRTTDQQEDSEECTYTRKQRNSINVIQQSLTSKYNMLRPLCRNVLGNKYDRVINARIKIKSILYIISAKLVFSQTW